MTGKTPSHRDETDVGPDLEADAEMVDPLVHVHIGPPDLVAASDRFTSAWKRVEAGEHVRTELHMGYDSIDALARMLTPERLAILHHLKDEPTGDVLGLSRTLHRRLPLVEADVEALLEAGLLHHVEGRLQPVAPEIVVTISI